MSPCDGIVYGMADPRTHEIRYVGKTERTLQRRKTQHLYQARHNSPQTHKVAWLRTLLESGVEPEMVILERVSTQETLDAAECRWIKELREQGCRLTNATDGGEGVRNPSPEARAKMSAASKAKPSRPSPMKGRTHTPEARAKISAAHKGRPSPKRGVPLSEETRERLSASLKGRTVWNKGKRMSEEQRAKLRAAWKRGREARSGRPCSPETRAKISAAKRAAAAARKKAAVT